MKAKEENSALPTCRIGPESEGSVSILGIGPFPAWTELAGTSWRRWLFSEGILVLNNEDDHIVIGSTVPRKLTGILKYLSDSMIRVSLCQTGDATRQSLAAGLPLEMVVALHNPSA